VLAAFKKIMGGWVRGEIRHDDVEPWTAFRGRVSRALARIASLGPNKTALVFTSAGTIAAAVGESLEVRSDQRVLDLSWSLYNGSLTELHFAEEGWHLRAFNGAAHLQEPRILTMIQSRRPQVARVRGPYHVSGCRRRRAQFCQRA
jgi:broad specificity phosphatase PhoE